MEGKTMPSYIDLFGGAGGWSVGLSWAGWSNRGLYEVNSTACATARANFSFPVNQVDLTEHRNIAFPNVDVVVGSPPCQGFSNEGYKRKEDIRNNLIYTYFEIIERIRPKYFVFENVPGFQRLYKGHFYDQFVDIVEQLGYSLSAGILNFSGCGVPQNRKRFVALGSLERPLPFPDPTHSDEGGLFPKKPLVTLWEAISDLPYVEHGERAGIFEYDVAPSNPYQILMREGSDKVYNHTTQTHSKRVLDKISTVPIGGNMKSIIGKYSENNTHYEGGYRRAVRDRPSYTAYWTRGMTSIHPNIDRFLSPRECARIQSFPDNFVFKGNTIEHYTQICNAVSPLFAKFFGDNVAEYFNKPDRIDG
jgi:DNA (cytosine-5)-methyltransferase 1